MQVQQRQRHHLTALEGGLLLLELPPQPWQHAIPGRLIPGLSELCFIKLTWAGMTRAAGDAGRTLSPHQNADGQSTEQRELLPSHHVKLADEHT